MLVLSAAARLEGSRPDAAPLTGWSSRALRALWTVTLVGLAIRLGWLLVAQPAAVSDALGYTSLAERWVDQGLYERFDQPTAWRTPGYIVFLAFGLVWSDSELWLGWWSVLASATVVPLVAMLSRQLGLTERGAIVAAGLAAVMPPLVLWAPVLGPENVQAPLLLGALVLAAHPDRSARTARWSGVAFGVAVLVRPESLVYLPVVAAVMWPGDLRAVLRRTAVIVAVAAAVCTPWVVRNQLQVGPVGLSSTGGVNFYLAHREDGYGFEHYEYTALAGLSEAEMSRHGYELGFASLSDSPFRLVGDVAAGTRSLYGEPRYAPYYSTRDFGTRGPYPLGVPEWVVAAARTYNRLGWMAITMLGVVGWATLVARRHRAALTLTGMALANWLCFAVVFFALARYRFPIEPFVCIAAAVALVGGSRALGVSGVRRRATTG